MECRKIASRFSTSSGTPPYPRLIALQQADRPGIILFRGGAYSDREMLALLDRVLARASTLGLEHSIVVVDRKRIRRRALPIGE